MSKKRKFELLWVLPEDKRLFHSQAAREGKKQYELFGEQVRSYVEKENSERKKIENKWRFGL